MEHNVLRYAVVIFNGLKEQNLWKIHLKTH
jgi:hypothetical protein